MKKQKISYRLIPFKRNHNKEILARRELPYEIKLASQLMLDDLCFNWNKARLEEQINLAIDQSDKSTFDKLSKQYKNYIWES
ncbi:IDEAL domain-containing protein [Gracilibacillus ureilyticus]|uniref:IDEAL domain-containing protein n=1 Tax=Gracilibacillus ureilyticus TaxID=531814 RepID=A0A1H9SII6_9BACI|nr:IDEAL domain-containing protein [Gracilibacillus ureilyticus]SER84465.1 IDEAL domain-containing protein [Gracilibacillus ureilyticus]